MEIEHFKIYKEFGPSILRVKIPENIVKKLNEYVEKTIIDKNKSDKLSLGEKLVGDVTQEFKLEKEFMEKSGWGLFLGTCVAKWIKAETSKEISKFEIRNSWIVRQFKNEYNPIHWHDGHISGAGFLKIPKILGSHTQNKQTKDYHGGNLQLIHGTRMFLCKSNISIKPKVGDFYFFPNYLMHAVFPFKESNEERRSISFNANIDENIYNVYGG